MDQAILDDIIKRLTEERGGLSGEVQLLESEVHQLCSFSREIFLRQPALLELQPPITICGDIRGQYLDLLRLFDLSGFPSRENYLFLGNYIDKGDYNLETICLLLAYKIKYPENFFLLRGNHECASIGRVSGLYDECLTRYNAIWRIFIDCFDCLPVAALIDNRILCMHGGLSPDLQNLNQIRDLQRPIDVYDSSLLRDLLWSDPSKEVQGWFSSDVRLSYTFGADKLTEFLEKHGLDLICRGHQMVDNGYEFFGTRQLVTIFSAPNYLRNDNAGAIMKVNGNLSCSFKVIMPAKNKRNNAGASSSSIASGAMTRADKHQLALVLAHKRSLQSAANNRPECLSNAKDDEKGATDKSGCVVCCAAPKEGACVPCGHVSACMSCLTKIVSSEGFCPICRAKIDQVLKIYIV